MRGNKLRRPLTPDKARQEGAEVCGSIPGVGIFSWDFPVVSGNSKFSAIINLALTLSLVLFCALGSVSTEMAERAFRFRFFSLQFSVAATQT